MTSTTSSRTRSTVVLALLATVALGSTACGIFASDDPSAPSAAPAETPAQVTRPNPDGGAPIVEGPKAPAVSGPAAQSELTDALGVFVSSTGQDTADGTHDHPFATIQAGIDKAKTVGKRVYVCAGTYNQALVIADSISVIGGLDCTANVWNTGSGVSRVQSPTSPAVRAKDINSATRLEGLDINAPNATAASGSSIGLIADHAAALVVARSKITSGSAVKGDDGTEGTQLSNGPLAKGYKVEGEIRCGANAANDCVRNPGGTEYVEPLGASGGSNTCLGAPGHVTESGARGGSGGLFHYVLRNNPLPPGGTFLSLDPYAGPLLNLAFPRTNSPDARTGAAGTNGIDGVGGTATGALTPDGYTPADGANGADGAGGSGGAGGNGVAPTEATPVVETQIWRGWGGSGGGAGGCPGLAGTAGKGGGASIAAMLIESPMTFDSSELISSQGGTGGLGTLGSAPTAGGGSGFNARADLTQLNSQAGGNGGAAGVSGNGGSGPSAPVAHVGAAPKLVGANKMTPGAGGAAIAARSRTDALGITKTVPATPAGASTAILAL